MEIKDTRRANLLRLLDDAGRGALESIGKAMARSLHEREPTAKTPNYANVLSQHKGGKPMGNKIARLLEDALGKKTGWMDTPRTADEAVDAQEAGQLLMNMDPGARDAWMQMGRTLADKAAKKPSDGVPFPGVPKGGRKTGGTQ